MDPELIQKLFVQEDTITDDVQHNEPDIVQPSATVHYGERRYNSSRSHNSLPIYLVPVNQGASLKGEIGAGLLGVDFHRGNAVVKATVLVYLIRVIRGHINMMKSVLFVSAGGIKLTNMVVILQEKCLLLELALTPILLQSTLLLRNRTSLEKFLICILPIS